LSFVESTDVHGPSLPRVDEYGGTWPDPIIYVVLNTGLADVFTIHFDQFHEQNIQICFIQSYQLKDSTGTTALPLPSPTVVFQADKSYLLQIPTDTLVNTTFRVEATAEGGVIG
jgi:hypothetical protein